MFVFFIISFAHALAAIRTQGGSLLLWEEPKIHSELLEEDKCEDGLGAKADEGWDVALVKCPWTLPQGCLEHIDGAGKLSWLCVHRPCFQDIQWLGHRGGNGTRAKAGSEMSDEVVAKVVGGKQGLLDLVIEAQLADGHQDRPAGCPVCPREKVLQAFLPVHSCHTIYCVLVVSSLFWRQLHVILHSDIGHITRSANEATTRPSHSGHSQTTGEWYRLSIRRHRLFGNLVNCKSSCGVGELPDQRCRESIVEREKAFGPDYDLCLSDCPNVSILLCLQLDLDEVKGMSTAGSSSTCKPAKVPATHSLLLRHPGCGPPLLTKANPSCYRSWSIPLALSLSCRSESSNK